MRVALKIVFDGKRFHGFARQPGKFTIEGSFIDILLKSKVFDSLKEAIFRVASRTDKGVSSFGNVIAFNTTIDPTDFIDSINGQLQDIYIIAFALVPDDFYPRHAIIRSYRYYLLNNGLDVDILLAGANCFTGMHDFRNFARVESHRNPVRTIENIVIWQKTGFVIIDVFAQTFLWHQVRRMIAALEKIGLHKLQIKDVQDALDSPSRYVDFGLASSRSLILTDVRYSFEFQYVNGYKKVLSALEQKIEQEVYLDR
jgi:tRNA pseudouridine38-40 synthase